MKSMATFQLLTMLVLITVVNAQETQPQSLENADGTSILPILSEAGPIIRDLEERGFEIVRLEFDIVSDYKATFRELFGQWQYGIIAIGDYRFLDLDLEVSKEVDGQWIVIASDGDASKLAAVNVKPSSDGLYMLTVRGYKFAGQNTIGRYCLIIFHD